MLCIVAFLMCCIIEFVLVKKFYSFFAWVALYFVGMLFGGYYSKKTSNLVLVVSAAVLIVFGILFYPSWLTQTSDYRYHTIWFHWVLGLFLFSLLFRILPHLIKAEKKHAALMHVDNISYEVYLTHHPLILGPLSMMFITQYSLVNILLFLIAVYILSSLLHYISSIIQKHL